MSNADTPPRILRGAPGKVSITPEMILRFAEYHAANPAWGSLHIVLDDDNLEDRCVRFCVDWACEQNDTEGAELAYILLGLSRSQRHRLGRFAEQAVRSL